MTRLVLVAAIVGGAIGCSSATTPDAKSLDPYARYLGALELARSGDPVDERELIGLLDDPNPLVRDGAVIALGRLGRPEHMERLKEMTFDRAQREYFCAAHTEVVRRAGGACPKCGIALSDRAAPASPEKEYFCPFHPNEIVQSTSGVCQKCGQALKERPLGGPNTPLVRADAVRALARLGDPRAVAAIVSALRGDSSVEVRRAAAAALESFADRREAVEALVEAFDDRSASVAHGVHAVLCRIAKRDDLPRQRGPWQEWLKQSRPQ